MLRVGLTGGLGSGKSTVAAMLRKLGAEVVSADDLGRQLMQRGEAVFQAIVDQFGPGVLLPGGELDRRALARIAFADDRAEELNAIVHPAVIARQAEIARELEARCPESVLVVESALLLETRHGGEGGWRRRFDCLLVVVAPEELRIERFTGRVLRGLPADAAAGVPERAEARRRMAQQMPDDRKAAQADWVLRNDGSLDDLERQVEAIWPLLASAAHSPGPPASMPSGPMPSGSIQ